MSYIESVILTEERLASDLIRNVRALTGHTLKDHPYGVYKFIMRRAEKPLIEEVLRSTGFNQSETAKILGINRGTLRKKIKEYGL